MNHTTHIKSKFSCLLLLTSYVLFIACQSKPNTIESHNTAQNPIEPTTTPESIPPTITTMPTVTTVPATVTPTPQPTLSRAEKEILVAELYKTNAGCKLPCWWGIIPGETDWVTAEKFLSTLAIDINTSEEPESDPDFVVQVLFPVTENLSEIEILAQDYYVNDGIIEIIDPETPRKMPSSTINNILDSFGLPTEVQIDTYGYSFGEIDPFRLALFFPQEGILVRYFDDAEFQNDHVVGCFGGNQGSMVLFSPKANLNFGEALNGTRALGTYGEQYYKPLEEATEMDIETFYQAHLDPNTEICIETPIELWQDR